MSLTSLSALLSPLPSFLLALLAALSLASHAEEISLNTLEHMIAINADGTPRAFALRTPSGVIPASQYSYSNHLQFIISALQRSGRTNILLYFFGGMNSVESSSKRAAVLADAIMQSSDYYPVCVVWASSLFNSYFDHLFWIRRGARDPVMGPALAPFYLLADIGRAFTRLPITLAYHGYHVADDIVFEPLDDEEENAADDAEIAAQHIRAASGTDNSSRSLRVLRRVVYTLGFPFRVITVPLIDACGKNAWDVMVARTRTTMRVSYTLDVPDDRTLDVNFAPPDGALALLASALLSFTSNDSRYAYTLIGHSLGTLLANELVRTFPELPCRNIVHMGSAASLRDTALNLAPYLQRHPNCTFYNLCLHEHADQNEYMWLMFLPRGSILEWIDSFLSDPLALDDLTIGKWNNALRTLPTIKGPLRHQVVIKAFGINDPVFNRLNGSSPEKHTDFSNPALRFWEPSFWRLPTEQPTSNTK